MHSFSPVSLYKNNAQPATRFFRMFTVAFWRVTASRRAEKVKNKLLIDLLVSRRRALQKIASCLESETTTRAVSSFFFFFGSCNTRAARSSRYQVNPRCESPTDISSRGACESWENIGTRRSLPLLSPPKEIKTMLKSQGGSIWQFVCCTAKNRSRRRPVRIDGQLSPQPWMPTNPVQRPSPL